MDKFEEVFKLLFLFAKSDHVVLDEEIQILSKFIEQNRGFINFEPMLLVKKLDKLNDDEMAELLIKIVDSLKEEISDEEKDSIAQFIAEVIYADNIAVMEEKVLFSYVVDSWKIDSSKFIK